MNVSFVVQILHRREKPRVYFRRVTVDDCFVAVLIGLTVELIRLHNHDSDDDKRKNNRLGSAKFAVID